jgi:hypothetical protein
MNRKRDPGIWNFLRWFFRVSPDADKAFKPLERFLNRYFGICGKDQWKVFEKAVGYILFGIGLIAVAAFLFIQLHEAAVVSDAAGYPEKSGAEKTTGILVFICTVLGFQGLSVGFLYALVLHRMIRIKGYPSKEEGYEAEVIQFAWGFGFAHIVFSLISVLTESYLSVFICFGILFPCLCFFIYRRFQ